MLNPTVHAAGHTPPGHHPTPGLVALIGIELPVLGVLTAVAALMLMWKRKETRRTQAVLMLVTGLAVAGFAGKVRASLEHMWTHAGSSLTSKIFGVPVPYAIALMLVLWFVLDMDLDGIVNKLRKKTGATNRHKANAFTPWLALLVPVALASLPFLGGLPHQLALS